MAVTRDVGESATKTADCRLLPTYKMSAGSNQFLYSCHSSLLNLNSNIAFQINLSQDLARLGYVRRSPASLHHYHCHRCLGVVFVVLFCSPSLPRRQLEQYPNCSCSYHAIMILTIMLQNNELLRK